MALNRYQYTKFVPEEQHSNCEISLIKEHIGEIITIHGSIYKIRKMKGFSFLILRTARDFIQCVCDNPVILSSLQEEACIRMEAEVVKEERAKLGAELHVKSIDILSRPTDLPKGYSQADTVAYQKIYLFHSV